MGHRGGVGWGDKQVQVVMSRSPTQEVSLTLAAGLAPSPNPSFWALPGNVQAPGTQGTFLFGLR